jgi:hypothetical protein
MSFFNKLFGGGEKETFIPSADLMPEDAFWALIEASAAENGGNPGSQEEALAGLLGKAPLQDLITFQNRYSQLRGQA